MKMKVNDIELYYEVYGEGEPLILCHGWMDDCSIWKSQIEFFAKKYKVIVYDHRGHGKSDKPEKNYSIQTLSNDLYSLIQKLNLEKIMIMGNSMGGMTAMVFALGHPDKVSKLVLVGTTARMAFSIRVQLWIMMHILPYESFARGVIDYKYYEPSEQVIKEAMERALRTPKYAAHECSLEFTKNYDSRDRISKIKVPTLIIVGDKDKITPVEMSQHLSRKIEGSKLEIIPNSKHIPMIDKVKELNEITEKFIR